MPTWHNRGAVTLADIPPLLATSSTVAAVGAGDPGSSRLVYAMVLGLVVVGIALVFLGFWIIRQTRPDLEVLAPLERMGDGDWKKRDPSTQRRMLDEVRPDGARPLASEPPPPPIDAEFEQSDHPVASFSDLGPGLVAEERDPTPVERGEATIAEAVDEAEAAPVDGTEEGSEADEAEEGNEADEPDEDSEGAEAVVEGVAASVVDDDAAADDEPERPSDEALSDPRA